MWVSKRLWQEMRELTKMDELTRKMKKIADDYADLVDKHIQSEMNCRVSTDKKRIQKEISELRKLYEELISRMQPFNVYISKRENVIFAGIQIIAASISVLSLFIMWLSLR